MAIGGHTFKEKPQAWLEQQLAFLKQLSGDNLPKGFLADVQKDIGEIEVALQGLPKPIIRYPPRYNRPVDPDKP